MTRPELIIYAVHFLSAAPGKYHVQCQHATSLVPFACICMQVVVLSQVCIVNLILFGHAQVAFWQGHQKKTAANYNG